MIIIVQGYVAALLDVAFDIFAENKIDHADFLHKVLQEIYAYKDTKSL